ncbi:MAG: SH3 domain-containing protein [Fibrobacteres bacterium]|jgi:hypothetical protein|nr:SH3 domain-containing protein [Fibrobacterota bacterium]
MPLSVYLLALILGSREEYQAYEECRSARQATTVWSIGAPGAKLRARESLESPTVELLQTGEDIILIDRFDGSGTYQVRTARGLHGYVRIDDVIKVVYPPRDTASEGCPLPSVLRLVHPLLHYIAGPIKIDPGPTPEELKTLELEEAPPSKARDSGTGRKR